MTELLAPAGNLEKLKIAISYGADAVYLAGQNFGLRSGADNFSLEEIQEAVSFAHQRNRRIYVVLNAFLHNQDLKELPEFARFLDQINVDAVICSDLGVIKTVQENSNLKIHVSTQASVVNSWNAKIWKNLGIERIVVGRELSITETAKIKETTGLEMEMFIHGAMCMAYSGNCTISNYFAGRDSNRGGCIQSCRYEYNLVSKDAEPIKSFFMSSKDLQGITTLPEFYKQGIDSLKVEGRMKSNLYIATVTKAYAQVLQALKKDESYSLENSLEELKKIPHRDYTDGALDHFPKQDSIYDEHDKNSCDYEMAGTVIEIDQENSRFAMSTRNKITTQMTVEVLPFQGNFIEVYISDMTNAVGKPVEIAQPNSIVWLHLTEGIEVHNVIRVNHVKKQEILLNSISKKA
ncbi:MAG: putative protease [bacterium]|jgi:putative protease